MLYDNTAHRDAAIAALAKEKVTWKQKKLTPNVAEFGARTDSGDPQAWLETSGPMDVGDDVARAIMDDFQGHEGPNEKGTDGQNALQFDIRPLQRGGINVSAFVVVWGKAVEFTKHLTVNGEQRYVSCVPKKSCYLCGAAHQMHACDAANTPRQLGAIVCSQPSEEELIPDVVMVEDTPMDNDDDEDDPPSPRTPPAQPTARLVKVPRALRPA